MELYISTIVDSVCRSLENKKNVDISELSKKVNLDVKSLTSLCKSLEEANLIEVREGFKGTTVQLKKVLQESRPVKIEGKVLDKYELEKHGVPASVRILDIREDPLPIYEISSVVLDPYTSEFMKYLQEVIAQRIAIEPSEIIDQRKSSILEDRFYRACLKLTTESFPMLSEKEIKVISGVLLHEVYDWEG